MNDIEVLEDIKTEEELYKYIINRATDKLPLEHEIFAIRNNDFHNLDYAIYVDGYISLDVIIRNIKKQEELENLLKERQSDKERIKELEEENEKIKSSLTNTAVAYANSIPISLIKEKKKEIREKAEMCNSIDLLIYAEIDKVLEELLKGE